MATTTPKRLMTAAELMALPDDGNRYELSRGVLICMAPAVYRSGIIGGRVFARLNAFVEQHRLGVCGIPDSGFKLTSDPDTVREPDAWFVRADRVPPKAKQAEYFAGAPDLAVEVLSPSDRFNDVMLKVKEYLEAGTRLVWVIDPEARATGVFRADGSYSFVAEDGILDGEDVLPGFTLPLRDVLR